MAAPYHTATPATHRLDRAPVAANDGIRTSVSPLVLPAIVFTSLCIAASIAGALADPETGADAALALVAFLSAMIVGSAWFVGRVACGEGR